LRTLNSYAAGRFPIPSLPLPQTACLGILAAETTVFHELKPMTKPELTRPLWLAVGYIGFSMIVMLSLAPAGSRPHSGYGGEYEHLLAYALVGAAFGMGYRTARLQLFSGLALSSAAAILELLQSIVPGRSPEITGFLVSSLGAWLGLAISIAASAVLRATK
jgi:VanZ family protein